MRKLKVVALILAAVLLFTGCSMFSRNESRAANQVVATVNGTPIYRNLVEKYFSITYFITNNTTVDTLASASKSDYRTELSSIAELYVKQQVLIQKAAQIEVSLSDDDKANNRKSADDTFISIKDSIKTTIENEAVNNSSLNVDVETENRYQEQIDSMGFNADDYYSFLNDQSLISKVLDYAKQFAQVTDDDVTSWYNQTLAEQQKAMDTDPGVFASNVYNNLICTYVPEDMVAVKHVLLLFKDKDLSEVASQLYKDEDAAEAIAILQPQINEMMPTAEMIAQQLRNGADINELIEQYEGDPGMTSGTAATTGYIVSSSTKDFLTEFKDAALTLKNVGDVSQPLVTYFGIHVIQNIKVYKKGAIPLDGLRDQIKTALLPSKQTEKATEMTDQWYKEATLTYDKDRLFN